MGVRPRIDNDIEFKFIGKRFFGSDQLQNLPHDQLEGKAYLIPSGKLGSVEDMELEEYEYDIVWNSTKELWVTTLTSGLYLLNVKAKGFKELNNVITINN